MLSHGPQRPSQLHRFSRRLAAGVAALALGLAGCGGGAPDAATADGSSADDVTGTSSSEDPGTEGADEPEPDEPEPDEPEDDGHSEPAGEQDSGSDSEEPGEPRWTIAEAQVPVVEVFDAPDSDEAIHELAHPREVGAPLTFLVEERGDGWLEVLLPVRPNGTTGWIREGDVTLTTTSYRVVVELSEHRLTVYDGDEVRIETPIGVGGDGTPTPPGRYYITELLQPPDPSGPYGPYAFGISGFSEVHLDFAGGEGVIGIHGTNDPSSIGRDSSNGCIRLDNEVITEMATFLPLGAPVEIRA